MRKPIGGNGDEFLFGDSFGRRNRDGRRRRHAGEMTLWPRRASVIRRQGAIRHATLLQNESHTQWAAREFGAESHWAETVEGTLVAKASIVEVFLIELDEQPTLDGVLAAPTSRAETPAASAEARARARIFE